MSVAGAYLTVWIGPTVPIPAPVALLQAIRNVEVTHSDEGRSGFQMTIAMGRSGATELMDYPLLQSYLLQPFNRVILVVTINAMPSVLMDGVITHQQLLPSNDPGASTLLVTGEDVSVMMDLTTKKATYPNLSDAEIAAAIVAEYSEYGLIPSITPPSEDNRPSPQNEPFQDGTDLTYLTALAESYGYVFYILPGPEPGTNLAYWGPRIRAGLPQPPLSMNLGPATNVDTLTFSYNALAPVTVSGGVQDRTTNQVMPVLARMIDQPVLSASTALLAQRKVRSVQLGPTSGLTYAQAQARAQAEVDNASDTTLIADGQLDTLRYGGLLMPRQLVDVRGAGMQYDGSYYVKSVTHSLQVGAYKQSFTLLRQGIGTAMAMVE